MHISFEKIFTDAAKKLHPNLSKKDPEMALHTYNLKQVAWNVTTVALATIAASTLFMLLPVGPALVLGGAVWLARQALADNLQTGDAILQDGIPAEKSEALSALSSGVSIMSRAVSRQLGIGSLMGRILDGARQEHWDPVALDIAGVHVWRNLLPLRFADVPKDEA